VKPPQENGSPLTVDSPLAPFKNADGSDASTASVTNIKNVGYDYGPGSLDPQPAQAHAALAAAAVNESHVIHVPDIDRTQYAGSFLINTYAIVKGQKQLVGVTPVFSRLGIEGCANCQDHLKVHSYHAIPGSHYNIVPASSLVGKPEPPAGTIPIHVEIDGYRTPSEPSEALARAPRADEGQGHSSAVVGQQIPFTIRHVKHR